MRIYSMYERIKGNSPLVMIFNQIMDILDTPRMFVAPSCTSCRSSKYKPYGFRATTAIAFYEYCLLEEYLHSLVANLADWKDWAEKYNSEFGGSWRYYAMADRLESIKEWGGGEEKDYNPDGSIRTEVTDKELDGYSLVECMRGHNDIFLTTSPGDWEFIYNTLHKTGQMSIFKAFEAMGTPLSSYRLENGEMVQNTWVDERLHEAREQAESDTMADHLFSVVSKACELVNDVKKLKSDSDNKVFFSNLPGTIEEILNFHIPIIEMKGGLI